MAYTDVWDVTAPLDSQAAAQGAADFRATKLDVMQRIASFGAGLFVNRPTPETTGATADWTGVMYWATDTKQVFRWNGAAWVDISTSTPSGSSVHFSDLTLGNLVNPGGASSINTVTVPGSFAAGTVAKIQVSGAVLFSAGGGQLTVNVNGTQAIPGGVTVLNGDLFDFGITLLGLTGIALSSTVLQTITGAPLTQISQKNNIAYVAGAPFTVVLGFSAPFTGSIKTFGMPAFMI